MQPTLVTFCVLTFVNMYPDAIEGRLLDAEDKVRIQAVSTVCELAKLSIQSFPSEVVLRATERLRDRKV